MTDDPKEYEKTDERRHIHRAAVDHDLAVDVRGENIVYTGLIKNISCGGIFVATDMPAEKGTVLRVRFSFPNFDAPVEADVQVQWVRDRYSEGEGLKGMGVAFVDLDPEVVAKINEYIHDKDVIMYDEGY